MTKPLEFPSGAENSDVISLAATSLTFQDRNVELRQIVVVLLCTMTSGLNHRRALLFHLVACLLARPPREVVAARQQGREEQIRHRGDELG